MAPGKKGIGLDISALDTLQKHTAEVGSVCLFVLTEAPHSLLFGP